MEGHSNNTSNYNSPKVQRSEKIITGWDINDWNWLRKHSEIQDCIFHCVLAQKKKHKQSLCVILINIHRVIRLMNTLSLIDIYYYPWREYKEN